MFNRHRSKINKTDRFPKGGPKVQASRGVGVCLFLTMENEQLFILKTITANYVSGCSRDHGCPYSKQ